MQFCTNYTSVKSQKATQTFICNKWGGLTIDGKFGLFRRDLALNEAEFGLKALKLATLWSVDLELDRTFCAILTLAKTASNA